MMTYIEYYEQIKYYDRYKIWWTNVRQWQILNTTNKWNMIADNKDYEQMKYDDRY